MRSAGKDWTNLLCNPQLTQLYSRIWRSLNFRPGTSNESDGSLDHQISPKKIGTRLEMAAVTVVSNVNCMPIILLGKSLVDMAVE
jgi:hypothetical protein